MIKLQKIEKQHIKFIVIGVVVFAVLVTVLMILALGREEDYEAADLHDGIGADQYKDDKALIIDNQYQLSQTYGYSSANTIREQLEKIVFVPDELAAATKGAISADGAPYHYKATLIESSFTLYDVNPEIYTFRLDVSDGRIYQVYVRPCEDAAVDWCYSTVAVRDGIVNFATAAVSEEALAEAEDWKNQF